MHGQFINFLYSNLVLKPAPGTEDRVYPIHAFKGKEYVTGFYQLTPEELAEINKTGGLWISFMGHKWPPVKIDAFVPAHSDQSLIYFGEFLKDKLHTLDYLDLHCYLLDVPEEWGSFQWKHIPDGGQDNDGRKMDVWDLEYRERYIDKATNVPCETGAQSGVMGFSEELVVVGRIGDLPRLQPLSFIYPSLKSSHLVLMHKEVEPPPAILNLEGERMN